MEMSSRLHDFTKTCDLAQRRTVRLPDLPAFTATFVATSHGITAVSRVDGLKLPQDDSLIMVLAELSRPCHLIPSDVCQICSRREAPRRRFTHDSPDDST